MGNCLEPSSTQIYNAKRAKMMKMAPSMDGHSAKSGFHPPYYYPPDPAHHPPPPPRSNGHGPMVKKPPSYVAINTQTGQQYYIPYPGAVGIPQYGGGEHLPYFTVPNGFPAEGRDDTDGAPEGVGFVTEGTPGKEKRNSLMDLFTYSGVLDFAAERPESQPEVVIVDFLDPPVTNVYENLATTSDPATANQEDEEPTNQEDEEDPAPANEMAELPPPTPPPIDNEEPESYTYANVIVPSLPPPPEYANIGNPVDPAEIVNPLPIVLRQQLSQAPGQDNATDPVDVVITYSFLGEYELDIVRRLTSQLESAGLTVWAERLGDSSRARKSEETAGVLLKAKALIVMVSEGSCDQRFIRDHVAMATVTNVAVFPVASEPPKEVLDAMPRELKVQLSPYNWAELKGENDDSFLFQLRSLARSVEEEVDDQKSGNPSAAMTPRGNLARRQSNPKGAPGANLLRRQSVTNPGLNVKGSRYWDVHFGHRDSVTWNRLLQTLKEGYMTSFDDVIPDSLQTVLFQSIKNRLATSATADADNGIVFRTAFVKFCKSSGGQDMDVWETIIRLAGIIQSVRDVFDLASTVRSLAVEYTDHFSNPQVLDALTDLLSDPNPTMRAVAVVSLACVALNSDVQSPRTLEAVEKTLDDGDHLVREAGCLALGHLKAKSAGRKLTHVWKTDDNPEVRETAKSSLDQLRD